MIKIENLVKRYGKLVALDHLNLEIEEGRDIWTARSKRIRKNDGDQLYARTFKIRQRHGKHFRRGDEA